MSDPTENPPRQQGRRNQGDRRRTNGQRPRGPRRGGEVARRNDERDADIEPTPVENILLNPPTAHIPIQYRLPSKPLETDFGLARLQLLMAVSNGVTEGLSEKQALYKEKRDKVVAALIETYKEKETGEALEAGLREVANRFYAGEHDGFLKVQGKRKGEEWLLHSEDSKVVETLSAYAPVGVVSKPKVTEKVQTITEDKSVNKVAEPDSLDVQVFDLESDNEVHVLGESGTASSSDKEKKDSGGSVVLTEAEDVAVRAYMNQHPDHTPESAAVVTEKKDSREEEVESAVLTGEEDENVRRFLNENPDHGSEIEVPAVVASVEAKKEEKEAIAKPKTVQELLDGYFMGTMKGRELSNFGVLDDVFFAARQAYLDAPDDPARKAAYLEAKEDLLHAMGNNVDQNTHDKAGIITDANRTNPISMKDIRALFDEEEKTLLGKSAEQGEGKEAVGAMLKEILGKNQEAVAFLYKSYLTARGDYSDILAGKIAEAQKKGKDLRLDRKAMNMRENYVEARNSLLHALTNLMRPGAGFIDKGEGEDRLREAALTKVLNAFSTEETAHDLIRDTSFDPVAGLLRDSFLVKEVGPVAEKVLASRATEDSREMLSHMLRSATNELAPLFEGRSDASRTEYEEARLDYLTFAETEAQVSTMNIKYYDKEGRFEERPQRLFPFFLAKDPYKEGRNKTTARYNAAVRALKKLYSDRRHLGAFRDKRDIDGRIGTALRNIERLDGQLVNRIRRGRFSNQMPGWIRVGKGRGGR